MFFQQLDVADGHATVNGFAHVVDGEQGDLHSGQGFHLYTGRADRFNGGCAFDAGSLGVAALMGLKLNGYMGQCQRVAQGNQVAGFFCGHDARQARHTQHITFFGCARLNDGQRCGQHLDATTGHPFAVRGGFGGNVNHVRLALVIKMGEGAHGSVNSGKKRLVHTGCA